MGVFGRVVFEAFGDFDFESLADFADEEGCFCGEFGGVEEAFLEEAGEHELQEFAGDTGDGGF